MNDHLPSRATSPLRPVRASPGRSRSAARHPAPALALALLCGCAAGEEPPAAPPTRDAREAPLREGATRLAGRLTYRELPATRSVEAYLGVEFVLTDDAGREHVLAPSDAVPHDALARRDGQRVEVSGEWYVPQPPPPGSEYPIDADGQPLARPGRYRVLTLDARDRAR